MGVLVLGGILYVILITVGERQAFQGYRVRIAVAAQGVVTVHTLHNTHSMHSYGAADANSTNIMEYTPYLNIKNNTLGTIHKDIKTMLSVSPMVFTASALTGTTLSNVIPRKPILTMFTTIHESESKRFIYENTVRNWQLLKPDIIPLLFTDIDPKMSTSIGHFAMQQGWNVMPVPKTSAEGNAILRHMFLKAQDEFDTPFYCYANGDILFDRNLTDTVRFLQSSAYGGYIDKLLVVGRRRNWSIDKGLILRDLSQVGHYAKNSSLFIPDAQDYFLTTRNGYPWTTIPDFVVGRVRYDNWLVATALIEKIPVVDATETVTALHQTGGDGNSASWDAKFETYINDELAGEFDFSLGHVTCGHFATQLKNGKITIMERKLNGRTCNERNVAYVKSPFTW